MKVKLQPVSNSEGPEHLKSGDREMAELSYEAGWHKSFHQRENNFPIRFPGQRKFQFCFDVRIALPKLAISWD